MTAPDSRLYPEHESAAASAILAEAYKMIGLELTVPQARRLARAALSSDGSGSPVEDNPDDPAAQRLQQGLATSSSPSTAAQPHGKGSDAASVAKPEKHPASAPHASPGPSEANWLTNYATCFVDDERIGRRLIEIAEILRSGAPAQGQPNLKQIEAAIDDHLGNIDATYEDSRRRCAQSILDLYAVPSTESK